MAEKLCEEALQHDEEPFINHYPHMQILRSDTNRLTQKLTKLVKIYEDKMVYGDEMNSIYRQAIKAYIYLIPLTPDPKLQAYYYKMIVEAQAWGSNTHRS